MQKRAVKRKGAAFAWWFADTECLKKKKKKKEQKNKNCTSKNHGRSLVSAMKTKAVLGGQRSALLWNALSWI